MLRKEILVALFKLMVFKTIYQCLIVCATAVVYDTMWNNNGVVSFPPPHNKTIIFPLFPEKRVQVDCSL
jgi:hypothetical protein